MALKNPKLVKKAPGLSRKNISKVYDQCISDISIVDSTFKPHASPLIVATTTNQEDISNISISTSEILSKRSDVKKINGRSSLNDRSL